MKIVRLGDVCKFRRGLTYKKSDEVASSKNIVLRANNIDLSSFTLNFNELKYISDEIEIPESKYITKDTILICTASGSKSHLGKVALIDKDYPYAFGGFMGLIVPDYKQIDTKYLFLVLTSKPFREIINKLTDGANINNLKFNLIENFKFSLPSIEEQRRIVARLDAAFEKIDRAIELAEKNLQNTQKLFEYESKIIFASYDNYEPTTLGAVYDVRDGTHDSPRYIKEGFPLITSKNLKNHRLDMTNIKYISQRDYDEINKRSRVSAGDILFAMIGTIGNPVIVEEVPRFAIKNVALFKVPKDQNNIFLKYYLDSSWVRKKMESEAKGATQKFVGLGYLRNFPINLPTNEVQDEIAGRLEALRTQTQKLQELYQKKLDHLKALRQSLLHQAFSTTDKV